MPKSFAPERNRFLAILNPADLALLAPHLEPVHLSQGTVLFEPDTQLTHVHFPTAGMVSLVALMAGGDAVETASIGPEGAVGLIQALGTGVMHWRVIVQIPGRSLRIGRGPLIAAVAASQSLGEAFARCAQAQMMQVLQLVACNARHTVEARLARWLLTGRDCIEGDVLPLTQEFLALMLGVRRLTVTQAARHLQDAKAIEYRRGKVRILRLPMLEQASCECYALIRERFDQLIPAQSSVAA